MVKLDSVDDAKIKNRISNIRFYLYSKTHIDTENLRYYV